MIENLDPREFEMRPSSLDEKTVEAILHRNYQIMRDIGRELGSLGVLPVQREPSLFGRLATTGNYSMRINPGFLVTGSGADKTRLNKSDLIFVEDIDYEHGIFFARGNARPSRETLIHDQIYRNFPDINVVLHTHDTLALNYNPENITENPIFFADAQEAREVVDRLQETPYVTLRKHGQFVMGETIEEALSTVREYHTLALDERTRFRTGLRSLAVAAGAVLFLGSAFEKAQFGDCAYRDNLNGTVTYTCPDKHPIPLKSWEGESAIRNPDGTYDHTLWVGGN